MMKLFRVRADTNVTGADEILSFSDLFSINDNGSVGIGTASPEQLLSLSAIRPELSFATTGTHHKGRVAQYSQDSFHFTSNLYYNGSSWQRENISYGGGVWRVANNYTDYRNVAPGANPATLIPRFKIADTGNVGIGTASPSEKLEVAGKIFSNDSGGGLYFADRDNQSNYWAWYSTEDIAKLWWNNPSTNFLAINGTSGNVGINTTSPSQALEVNGYILADNFNASGVHTIVGASAGGYNTGNELTAAGYNAGYLNTGTRLTTFGYYAGSENAGDYVTAIGSYAGHENTGDRLTATGHQAGYLNKGTYVTATGYQAGYQNEGNYSTGIGYEALKTNTGNNVVAIGDQAGEGNTLSDQFIVKQTRVNAVPLIQGNFSSGNVGIGTASPATITEISQTFSAGSYQNDFLRLTGKQAGAWFSSTGLEFYWNDTGNHVEWSMAKIIGKSTYFAPPNAGSQLEFYTKSVGPYADAPTVKMVIDRGGNVGIGTTTPTHTLNVVGNVNITGNLTVGGLGQGVPAGAIMAFNSATCPVGWVPADGQGGTPDLRGLFVRGAGTSTSYTMANGTAFSAAFDTYQNDSFQMHYHDSPGYDATPDASGNPEFVIGNTDSSPNQEVQAPRTAGTAYGTPRTGAETRPASYALTYCQKTTEDSGDSTTIWGESGNDIVPNNVSKNVHLYEDLTVDGQVSITGASRMRATKTSTQSIPNTAGTTILFDTEDYDNLGEYNPATGMFTATEAGYYFVKAAVESASVSWAAGRRAYMVATRSVGASAYLEYHEVDALVTKYIHLIGSDVLYMQAGETVKIVIWHDQGGAVNWGANGAPYNYFTVHRLS